MADRRHRRHRRCARRATSGTGAPRQPEGRVDRARFPRRLLAAPLVWRWFAPLPPASVDISAGALVAAGLLVGVGVRMGNGCTLSGMTNPAKVKGVLDLAGAWDPSRALDAAPTWLRQPRRSTTSCATCASWRCWRCRWASRWPTRACPWGRTISEFHDRLAGGGARRHAQPRAGHLLLYCFGSRWPNMFRLTPCSIRIFMIAASIASQPW